MVPVEHIGVTPFLSPPFLESQRGLKQWAERKRREHRLGRGSLELETWLSLMKTTLDTFGKCAGIDRMPARSGPRGRSTCS